MKLVSVITWSKSEAAFSPAIKLALATEPAAITFPPSTQSSSVTTSRPSRSQITTGLFSQRIKACFIIEIFVQKFVHIRTQLHFSSV
jgi:hypothetical protein